MAYVPFIPTAPNQTPAQREAETADAYSLFNVVLAAKSEHPPQAASSATATPHAAPAASTAAAATADPAAVVRNAKRMAAVQKLLAANAIGVSAPARAAAVAAVTHTATPTATATVPATSTDGSAVDSKTELPPHAQPLPATATAAAETNDTNGYGGSYASFNSMPAISAELSAGANAHAADDEASTGMRAIKKSVPPPASAGTSGAGSGVEDQSHWQTRFQAALQLPVNSAGDRLVKAIALRSITEQFCSVAEAMARIIIEESSWPEHLRTYKPLKGKGIAGGEKYSAHGIFVKLTRDFAGIYGGDGGAAKAAKHEIKSLKTLIGCHIENLFFPLMCVVDYLGLRLVCTSFIPGIGGAGQSLVYGSQDAGRTVYCSDPIMNDKVRQACSSLNLKAHVVIGSNGVGQLIFGPADLEGHLIPTAPTPNRAPRDQYYLLDFARLFPAESPLDTPGGHDTCGELIVPDATPAPDYSFASPLAVADEPKPNEFFSTQNVSAFIREQLTLPVPIAAASTPAPAAAAAAGTADTKSDSKSAAPTPTPAAAPAALELRVLPRSEGVIAFNVSAGPAGAAYNERASLIVGGGVRVFGKALLFQNTGRVFFSLMRPELVKRWMVPLSSDAFSGFGTCAKCHNDNDFCRHGASVNHDELERCTRSLFHTVIPEFAAAIDSRTISPADGPALVREMHKVGINVRWLGVVRQEIKLEYVRRLMLSEVITRTVRQILTGRLRAARYQTPTTTAPALSKPASAATSPIGASNPATNIVPAPVVAAGVEAASSSSQYHQQIGGLPGSATLAPASGIVPAATTPAAAAAAAAAADPLTYEPKRAAPPIVTRAGSTSSTDSGAAIEYGPVGTQPSGVAELYDQPKNSDQSLPALTAEPKASAAPTAAAAVAPTPRTTAASTAAAYVFAPAERLDQKHSAPATNAATTKPALSAAPSADAMRAEQLADLRVYADVAIRLFNLVFGASGAAGRFWSELKGHIKRKFVRALNDKEVEGELDLRTEVLKFPLFVRLQQATGITFNRVTNERLFLDPTLFEVAAPFSIDSLESLNCSVKSIDFDEELDRHLYELAMADSAPTAAAAASGDLKRDAKSAAPTPAQVAAATVGPNAVDVVEAYHARALSTLGALHPVVITAAFKLALYWSRKRKFKEAEALVLDALLRCERTFGIYSPTYVQGLITVGEVHQRQSTAATAPVAGASAVAGNVSNAAAANAGGDKRREALFYFEKALQFTEKLLGHHPLIGKLCSYIGRLQLEIGGGGKESGVRYLNRGYSVYEDFYGKGVAELLAPLITMGKGEEMATALGALALQMKSLVPPSGSAAGDESAGGDPSLDETTGMYGGVASRRARYKSGVLRPGAIAADAKQAIEAGGGVSALYQRLRTAIQVIEDMEGVSRGYFMGSALELRILTASDAAGPLLFRLASILPEPDAKLVPNILSGKRDDVRVYGDGALGTSTGELASFFVQTPTSPQVRIMTPHNTDLCAFVTRKQPGGSGSAEYRVFYTTSAAGRHDVFVSFPDGKTATGEVARHTVSFAVKVSAGAISHLKSQIVNLPTQAIATQPMSFSFLCRDSYGNPAFVPKNIRAFDIRWRAYQGSTPPRVDYGKADDPPHHITTTITCASACATSFWVEVVYDPYSTAFAPEPRRRALVGGPWHVEFKWPAGQGYCGKPLIGHGLSSACCLCRVCALKLHGGCLKCRSQMSLHGQAMPARLCQLCSSGDLSRRCRLCESLLTGAPTPALICQMCSRNSGNQFCFGRPPKVATASVGESKK